MTESDAGKKRKRSSKTSLQTVKSNAVATAAVNAKSSSGPLSAVAARKLALARQQREQEEAITIISGTVNHQAVPVEEEASEEDNIAEASSSNEEGEDLANPPSTSKESSFIATASPSAKRYFDSIPPSTSTILPRHSEVDQEDVYSQHDRSMAEDDTEPETSSAAAMRAADKQARTSTRGPGSNSKRRKRTGENYRGYFDPSCISSWKPARGTANWVSSDSTETAKQVMIGMQPGETIIAKGVYSLQALRGAIHLDCAVLTPAHAPLEVFAPSTHPLPVLSARLANSSIIGTSDIPIEEGLSDYPVVVLLRDRATGIEGIEGVCRLAGMPIPGLGMWGLSTGASESLQLVSGRTFQIITEPEPDLIASILPENWRLALGAVTAPQSEDASMQEGPIIALIQGSKGTGKSTFSKLLINSLLHSGNQVAYLDLDIGQTELAPSGLASLHLLSSPLIGPSFSRLHHPPIRAHYIGSASPKNDPARYLAAAQDLLETYNNLADHSHNGELHLVINTQGWTKGLGADLLIELHNMLAHIASSRSCKIKVFDFAPSTQQQYGAHANDPPPSTTTIEDAEIILLQPIYLPEYGPPKLTPADLRTLGLVSYLHLTPGSFTRGAGPSWDFQKALVHKRPYQVPWSTFRKIDLLGSEDVAESEILRALDVSLVGLLEAQEEKVHQQHQPDPSLNKPLQYSAGAPPALVQRSNCLGLGIIRSIDSSNSSFQILSPLSPDCLERVNALQKGEIELPTVLMVDHTDGDQDEGVCGMEWSRVPYLERRGDTLQSVGSGRRRARRNVMRRSQMH